MYKKVIVPVAPDAHSERALAALEKAMSVSDGEIVLCHATECIPNIVGGEAREQLKRENEANGEARLAALAEKLKAAGRTYHTRIESGNPDEFIAKIADEENADLVVMATDGVDNIGDLLLGTITERVLRNTDVDLLVLRKKD